LLVESVVPPERLFAVAMIVRKFRSDDSDKRDFQGSLESPDDVYCANRQVMKISHPSDVSQPGTPVILRVSFLILISIAATWFAGCSHRSKNTNFAYDPSCGPCQTMLQQIEYPDVKADPCDDNQDIFTAVPVTISNFKESDFWDLTVEQCVELALANSDVLQKLGGVIVNSPQAARTLYDQAIFESSQQGAEAALSAFDAQVASSFNYIRTEQFAVTPFQSPINNSSAFRLGLTKQTAAGTSFGFRNLTDYNRIQLNQQNEQFNFLDSTYTTVNQFEVRQPLWRGFGTKVNRIAGPNPVPGQYNGVLIGRIQSDISLADFEAAVRDLIRDVEQNYWELYFAYRQLDTDLAARDSARETWENRKLRYENGIGRPDEEAQARQQYFNFQGAAQNTLTGVLNGAPGLLGSERNLRRLMGLPPTDGRIIKPVTDPALAPVVFDWEQSQQTALTRRVELRRQKWTVKQRELELCAARLLNKWRFDLVGQYGFKGFGDNLFGGGPPDQGGGAVNDFWNGDLDDWQLGFEMGGAIGNRTQYLAERNAELNLTRAKAILREQERQIMHDLNAAYIEVDRAHEVLKTSLNSRLAVQEELEPKQRRVIEGQDQVFFLLDAVQRAAAAERAAHRSIADYNQALLNYAYTTGSLLSRYNVTLTEGQWSEDAQENAFDKARRFVFSDRNKPRDLYPVSMGAFDQSAPPQGTTMFGQQSIDPDTPAPNSEPGEEGETENGESDAPEVEAPKPADSSTQPSAFSLGSSSQRKSSGPLTAAKKMFNRLR
jgi:outer membrane protein TolC